MSRPRKDSNQPDMRIEMLDAFWRLLEQQRIEKINVCSVTAEAGCNRGTFYYHFADMDELIYQALSRELVEDRTLPSTICHLIVGTPGHSFHEVLENRHFERLRLLFVNGGMERAERLLQRLVSGVWTEILHPDGGELAPETAYIVGYAVGGMVGMFSTYLAGSNSQLERDVAVGVAGAFLKDNSVHMLHQLSRTEDVPEEEIVRRLRESTLHE